MTTKDINSELGQSWLIRKSAEQRQRRRETYNTEGTFIVFFFDNVS